MVKRSLVALGIIAGLVMTGCSASNGNNNNRNVATASQLNGSKVDLGDKQAAVDMARKMLDDMYNNGAYFQMAISNSSNDDIIFIYNKDKSCYAETMAGCPLYYDTKGNLRVFTSPYKDERDISPLLLADNAVDVVEHGGGEVYKETINVKDMYDKVLEQINESRAAEESTSEATESNTNVVDVQVDGESTPETSASNSTEETKETLSAEEEALQVIGYNADEIDGSSYDSVSIKINGRDNIYELYNKTFGNKDEATKFVDDIFTGDDNKEDDSYEFIFHHSEDDKINGIMLRIHNDDTNESIGWYFDGYYGLGGDWTSLGDDWFSKKLESDQVKSDMEGIVKQLGEKLKAFKENNFTEEQINEMDNNTVETEVSAETEAETTDEVSGIVRSGSFKDTVDNLLKEDGLSEADTSSFKVPDGYEDTDKARMIDLYNKLIEWDATQQDGTLISPLSPDDVEFATGYIKACEDAYNSTVSNNAEAVDEYGTVYWKDTVEVFLKAIQ